MGRYRTLLLLPLVFGLVAACMPLEVGTAPPTPSAAIPAYAPSGSIDPPASGECKSVLVAGDSLLGQSQKQIKATFADHG
jgi:hypothetical protein